MVAMLPHRHRGRSRIERKRARRVARLADRVNHPAREAARIQFIARRLERGARNQGISI